MQSLFNYQGATNVLTDALLGREPYYDLAYNILSMCADKKVYGYMAAHSIPNLFYILRKSMTKEADGMESCAPDPNYKVDEKELAKVVRFFTFLWYNYY